MAARTIRFSKPTDTLIRNFFGAKTGSISTSNMIELAILYHEYSGEYMELGVVSAKEEHPDYKITRVYVSANSDLSRIIETKKAAGISFGDMVRDVIENGIVVGDRTILIDSEEYFTKRIELRSFIRQGRNSSQEMRVSRTISAQDSADDEPAAKADNELLQAKQEQKSSEPPDESVADTPDRTKKAKRITFLSQFTQSSFR